MPNYRRARVDGGAYFFTINTFRRRTFLTDADVRAALRAAEGAWRRVARARAQVPRSAARRVPVSGEAV